MLRITITNDGPEATQSAPSSVQDLQAVDTRDAGPGPGPGAGGTTTAQADQGAEDIGGPPAWLVAVVGAAMASSQAPYGSAPESVVSTAGGASDGGVAPV